MARLLADAEIDMENNSVKFRDPKSLIETGSMSGFPTDGDVAAAVAELGKCSSWHPKNPEEFCRRLLDAVRAARGLPGPDDMTMAKLMADIGG